MSWFYFHMLNVSIHPTTSTTTNVFKLKLNLPVGSDLANCSLMEPYLQRVALIVASIEIPIIP